jgi:hypothetical protein
MPLKQFGTASPKLYSFTQAGVVLGAYSDNFANLVPKTSRIFGMDGGFPEFGDDRPPSEIGTVRQSVTLVATTRALMEAKRDLLKQIADWGKQKLVMTPTDGGLERSCYATINSIQMNKNEGEHTDLWQTAQIIWQVVYPRWRTVGTESVLWDDGWAWDDGTVWGGGGGFAASGTSTSTTVTNNGKATVQPRISILCGAGQTVTNPIIQRLVNNIVIDEVLYVGTLVAEDALEINCRAWSVELNNTNAYSSAFDFTHPSWFRLEPGANTVRVLFTNPGDAATVQLAYYEEYY